MKKTIRRPNFIDIAVALVIAAVALTAFYLSRDDSEGTPAPTVSRSFVVELTNLEPEMADCLAVGDEVIENERSQALGTVANVEVIPYTVYTLDQDAAVYRQSEVPGRITLRLTIETQVTETETQLVTPSGYALRVGNDVLLRIAKLYAHGYIVWLER